MWYLALIGDASLGQAQGAVQDLGLIARVLNWVAAHPYLAGAGGGVLGVLLLFVLRKPIKFVVKFAWAVATAPFVTAYRMIRRHRGKGYNSKWRTPYVNEIAFFGPCDRCGSRRQRRARVISFTGGVIRGIELETQNMILGCPDCTRAIRS